MPPIYPASVQEKAAIGFNPSKEMTAVPPSDGHEYAILDLSCFNPSKEMTAVPPTSSSDEVWRALQFQPLKGNDGRAAGTSLGVKVFIRSVSTPQRK